LDARRPLSPVLALRHPTKKERKSLLNGKSSFRKILGPQLQLTLTTSMGVPSFT